MNARNLFLASLFVFSASTALGWFGDKWSKDPAEHEAIVAKTQQGEWVVGIFEGRSFFGCVSMRLIKNGLEGFRKAECVEVDEGEPFGQLEFVQVQGLKSGDHVLDPNGREGKVYFMFKNKRVAIVYVADGTHEYRVWRAIDLKLL